MGEYVQIGDLNTWYEEQGAGDSLVLFHGGLSTNETWAAQIPDLAAHFRVVAPERRGHGHTPDREGPLSYDLMAEDMIGFLETVAGGPAHIVGWSGRHRRLDRGDGPPRPGAQACRHQRELRHLRRGS